MNLVGVHAQRTIYCCQRVGFTSSAACWWLVLRAAQSLTRHACSAGETRSEGGFAENKVSVASLLDVQEAKDQKGKTYYKYEILTRTGAGAPAPCIVWPPLGSILVCAMGQQHACMHTEIMLCMHPQPTAMRAAATS